MHRCPWKDFPALSPCLVNIRGVRDLQGLAGNHCIWMWHTTAVPLYLGSSTTGMKTAAGTLT